MTTLDCALDLVFAGVSVVPCRLDGSKAPALPAGHEVLNRERQATLDELDEWFGQSAHGIGALCGAISDRLECLDFDAEADQIYPAWAEMVEDHSPGLVARLVLVRTPSAGRHCWYRVDGTVSGKLLLASDPNKPRGQRQTLIETRGEGNYAIVPGSPPQTHETGRPYEYLIGNLATDLQRITVEELALLHRYARMFDRRPARQPRQAAHQANGFDVRPGDDYDLRGPPWEEILRPHGWEMVRDRGDWQTFRRPGKERGISATAGYCKGSRGEPLLRVFTTSATPLEEGAYGRFRAHAALNHQGDLSAAAAALVRQGYGQPRNGAHATGPPGQSGPATHATGPPGRTAAQIIRDYWRQRYNPTFKRGPVIYSATDGREVRGGEAQSTVTSTLIDLLASATDAARYESGDVIRSRLPTLFRTWASVAWGDILDRLPVEGDGGEICDTAQEDFRRALSTALLTMVTLAHDRTATDGEVVRIERRALLAWADAFAKPGGWAPVRTYRLWCRKQGDTTQIALRVELFTAGQIHVPELAKLTQRRFSDLCSLYGIGTPCKVKSGSERAVMLAGDYLADLMDEPDIEFSDATADSLALRQAHHVTRGDASGASSRD